MAKTFFPQQFMSSANAGGTQGATNVIVLGVAMYSIRATLFDPSSNAPINLPSHAWLLLHQSTPDGPLVALPRGSVSDARGYAAITRSAAFAPGRYALAFTPVAPAIRKRYVADGEAWIDLATKDWADPPNSSQQVERRNLLRVPAWSSIRKAQVGGGFSAGPTGATQFSKTGWIDVSELPKAGAPPEIFDLALDHNWVRAKVKYFFANWKANKEEVLPPGVVVEAVRSAPAGPSGTTFARVGAGTAITQGAGTAYMLLEGEKNAWSHVHFQFAAPKDARVDLTLTVSGGSDQRLTATGALPAKHEDRSSLPQLWHSKGMRAAFATGGSAPNPNHAKTWDVLRADLAKDAGALDATVSFFLDDVVLGDDEGEPLTVDATKQVRPTLFDHYLQIIRPDAQKPHLSDVKLAGLVIPADRAFVIGASPPAGRSVWSASTRLVHFEGKFHDLRDERVQGRPGVDACVGARVAKADAHPLLELTGGNPHARGVEAYQMHQIDVPDVRDPATNTPLQHLLLYIPLHIEQEAGVASATRDNLSTLLNLAAERWSQGHPGITTIGQAKRYALVPKDASKRSNIITRIRTYFGEVTSGEYIDVVLKHDTTPGQDARSSNGAPGLISDGTIDYYDSAVAGDMSPGPGDTDQDGLTLQPATIAHELGHALGLPDEYVEYVDPSAISKSVTATSPFLPSFSQPNELFTDYRPFYTDISSMMAGNMLPRLRHVWHHCKLFNEDSAFATAPERPYELVHETLGGGITYTAPPDSPSPPYRPIFADVSVSGGRSQCALFRLGDDEGSLGEMFAPASIPAAAPAPVRAVPDRFQAILMVRARLRFVFTGFAGFLHEWQVMKDFHEKLFAQGRQRMSVRFVLVGPAPYSRVAVLLLPYYAHGEFSASLNPLSPEPMFDPADVVFRISRGSATPPASPFQMPKAPASPLHVEDTDFVFEPVMRYLLGVRTWNGGTAGAPRVVDTAPLHAGDMQGLARLVERHLGEANGARRVGVF